MDRQIHAASNKGDVVWEPFGGLASASVAAVLTGRIAYTAEIDENSRTWPLDDWRKPKTSTTRKTQMTR
ncbi:MAG: hypothetical protein ACLUJX_00080 [Bifidobacterium longum]